MHCEQYLLFTLNTDSAQDHVYGNSDAIALFRALYHYFN